MRRMNPIRIMIVDNSSAVRMGVATYLESQAGIVLATEASNGVEAIKRYRREKADLVLMDLDLPDASGIVIMQHMHEINPRVPVILLTSAKGSLSCAAAAEAGAASVIQKHVKGQELSAAIDRAMREIEGVSVWGSRPDEDCKPAESVGGAVI